MLARGLTRAGIVLVLGGLGVLVWRLLVLAGLPTTYRGRSVPAGMSLAYGESALRLVDDRLGASLETLLLALVLGAVVGFGAAALRAATTPAPGTATRPLGPPSGIPGQPVGAAQGAPVASSSSDGVGQVVGGVGWLVGLLWTPPVPVALAVVVLAVMVPGSGGAARSTVPVVALGGVVALLVGVAASERWRRRAWLAGVVGGAAAVGRSLAAITGALVVAELVSGRPGVGGLLAQALVTQDRYVVADAATALLLIALVGQLVGAVAGSWLDRLDPTPDPAFDPATHPAPNLAAPGQPRPPSPVAGERSVLGTVLRVGALATLVVPVLLLAGSLFAGNTNRFDLAHPMAGASAAHPLGTDQLGRDVLARLLVGVQHALLSALGGVLLAAVVGVAWGALAVLVARRLPGAGGPVAEVVLAPARLVTVAPLLLAGIILAGADRWPATLVVAVVVAPRVAAAVAELDRPVPYPVTTLLRTVGGLLLAAVGVAVAVLVGLGLLGLVAHPPTPSLGGVLSDSLPTLIGSDEGVYAAVVALLTTVPWLLAGSALLRHPRRPEALATLDS